MKLMREPEDGTHDRKLIKSQVEKRRRERINHSLERLRTMLLQEPQQTGGAQRRVEKAEILEQTVVFLQSNHKRSGGHNHSFHDGFSSCLQRASHFLGPDGKDLGLEAALDASLAARLANPDSAGLQRTSESPSSSSLPHTKSILQLLKQKSRWNSGVNSSSASPPQPQRHHLQTRTSPQSKQSLSQSGPFSKTLWRPWP
ncbi:transcription factor HES-7.1-A-like [Synchiropus splendidus]|uniref:transcription factor HES-7.1-A-like n=1 Tax=Synchiropus splendidus TaxID=270530 RepID=UPI00237ECC5D|nr:transcription factor HES-7.1-A-like [Synchiropus splendidus]